MISRISLGVPTIRPLWIETERSGVTNGFHWINRDPWLCRKIGDQQGNAQHPDTHWKQHRQLNSTQSIEVRTKENGAGHAEENPDHNSETCNRQSLAQD